MDEEITTEGTEGQPQGEGQPSTPAAPVSAVDRYAQIAEAHKAGKPAPKPGSKVAAKPAAKPAAAAAAEGDDNDEPDAGDLAEGEGEGEGEAEPEKKPGLWEKFKAQFGGEKKQLTEKVRTLEARDAEREVILKAAQQELAVYRQALVEAGILDEPGAKLRAYQLRDAIAKQVAAVKQKKAKAFEDADKKAAEEEAAAAKHAEEVEQLESEIAEALAAHPGLTREKLIEAANADLETAIADIAKKVAPRPPRQQPKNVRKPAGAGAVKKHPLNAQGAIARYEELAGTSLSR